MAETQTFTKAEVLQAFRSSNPQLKGTPDDAVLNMILEGSPGLQRRVVDEKGQLVWKGGVAQLAESKPPELPPVKKPDSPKPPPKQIAPASVGMGDVHVSDRGGTPTAAYTTINIPGVGDVDFPSSMTPAQMNAAAQSLHEEKAPKGPTWKDASKNTTFAGLSGVDPSTLLQRGAGAVAGFVNNLFPGGDTRNPSYEAPPMTPEQNTGAQVGNLAGMAYAGASGVKALSNYVDLPSMLLESAAGDRVPITGSRIKSVESARNAVRRTAAGVKETLAHLTNQPGPPVAPPQFPEHQYGYETPGPVQTPLNPSAAAADELKRSAQMTGAPKAPTGNQPKINEPYPQDRGQQTTLDIMRKHEEWKAAAQDELDRSRQWDQTPQSPTAPPINPQYPSSPLTDAQLEQMRTDAEFNSRPDIPQRESTPAPEKPVPFKRAGTTKSAMKRAAEKNPPPPNKPVGYDKTKRLPPQ